jgi:predicted negative regulator of RcsB-dependent stress response
MAIELLDEHEQGERVRSWLRENGSAIVGGIALGVAAVVGYQWWGQSQAGHRADAAMQFMALQDAATAGQRDAVESMTSSLVKDYADTPYAVLADLALADVQLQAGEQEAALTSLRRAAAASADEGMKQLVITRQARVEIAAGKFDQAL